MIFVISHFGFEGGICLLIALVPVHCFLITFRSDKKKTREGASATVVGSLLLCNCPRKKAVLVIICRRRVLVLVLH